MHKIAGLILLAPAVLVSLPHLLYLASLALHWVGLPLKIAEQLENARQVRRAERIWALQAVCMTAIAVSTATPFYMGFK
jgi:hypothetical protein